MICTEIINYIKKGGIDEKLSALYGKRRIDDAKKRYLRCAAKFLKKYGDLECRVFSVPGRSEISGNHTDHNRGRVLAASVDVDVIAFAAKTDDGVIRVKSEGFDEDVCSITNPGAYNKYTSKALIYGVSAGFEKNGYKTGGFCAYTMSDIAKGSGLSSSAAFENLIGYILSVFYNKNKVKPVAVAKISKYAENEYFGKPCGLMDQLACACGGVVYIDFENDEPYIKRVDMGGKKTIHSLCIVNTGKSHSDLNDDYASVPKEMKSVAEHFNKEVLRAVTEKNIFDNITQLRAECGDRAVLRAIHFERENERVKNQFKALSNGDIKTFMQYVNESGRSSYQYLQNVYSPAFPAEQGISLALCISEGILKGKGAFRVHGGGFAGTIQAFVPPELLAEYKKKTEKVFGKGACAVLNIRKKGLCTVI